MIMINMLNFYTDTVDFTKAKRLPKPGKSTLQALYVGSTLK